MTRQSFSGPGDHYIDAWPSGEFVVLFPGFDNRGNPLPDPHLETHLGRVDFPPGEFFGLLYLHCVPGFWFGGQRHDDGQMQEWSDLFGWRPSYPPLSARAVYVGSALADILPAGYQFVNENTGLPVERWVTYGPKHGLSEWCAIGAFDIAIDGEDVALTLGPDGLQIGQLHDGDPGLGLWDGTTLRFIEPGLCTFCNVHRIGEAVTLSFAKPGEAIRIDTTLAELRAMPPVVSSQPPAPSPVPPQPPVPPTPKPEPPKPDPGPTPEPPKPPKEPPMPSPNANPSYDEFIKGPSSEAMQVRAAYLTKTGHEPAIPDYFHNAWRRLRERWTLRDLLHDIKGEPLEDGGPGGADPR